jgi:hypothetical protein
MVERLNYYFLIRGGERQGHLALPFLFISFGNPQEQGHLAIENK